MEYLMLDLAKVIQEERMREAERARLASSTSRRRGISPRLRRGLVARRVRSTASTRPAGAK